MTSKPKPTLMLHEDFRLTDHFEATYTLAYKADRSVFIARADGQERRIVFDESRRSIACPLVWSHDDKTLFESYDQLYAIDTESSATRTITNFPESETGSVVWCLKSSDDDRRLFFKQSLSGPPLSSRLCVIDSDGSNYRIIMTSTPDRHIGYADIHWPTGLILMSVHRKGGVDYYTANLSGEEPRHICEGPARMSRVILSSDGTSFISAGIDGLHHYSVTDGTHHQLSRSGDVPAWSPDGKKIAFMNEDHELWLLEVHTQRFIRLAWFSGRNFSGHKRGGSYKTEPVLSPDGRMLWFRLTKTRHLRKPQDPNALEKLKASPSYQNIPEDQREAQCQRYMERQYWAFVHKSGVVDLKDNKVWLSDEYWRDVGWSPIHVAA